MALTLIDSPKENRILAALSAEAYGRLLNDLDFVHLPLGQALYDSGGSQAYLYFPTTAIVSLVFTTQNGASSELAITGNDGLVGITTILGGFSTTHRAVVQSAGNAYRLRADLALRELEQGGELQPLALRYTQALLTQMAQSVVCNRHHSVDKQLCRWLLLSLDRLPTNHLTMTQELIANMLGVRREGVTEAAGKLQAAGLIHYHRGHITVNDRAGLEARVCECYGVVKSELERLFLLKTEIRPGVPPRPPTATLRQQAEARLLSNRQTVPEIPLDGDHLLHELRVHQLELELQNEELRAALTQADALRDRYADIYDFAPVGYFTLTPSGKILDLNLAGAILLGIKRSEKDRHRFTSAVTPECLQEFNHFLADVLKTGSKKICEISLLPTRQRPKATVRIQAVPDDSGDECRMVVIDVSAEKKADRLLAERDQYLRAMIDGFPFMAWVKDEQSRYLAVNEGLSTAFGWPSPDSMLGKNDLDISPKDLADDYRADDRAVLASGESKSIEEMVEIDGHRHWTETYKSPMTVDGLQVGTMGYSRDITRRKEIETALQDSGTLQRSIFDSVPSEIAVIDGKGVIVVVNEHWRLFASENASDLQTAVPHTEPGTNYLNVCQAAINANAPGAVEARDGILAVLAGQIPCFRTEYQCHSPTQQRWFSMTVTPLTHNPIDGAVITHTDLTASKHQENQVRQQAFHDELTRLPNRLLLNDRLRRSIASNKRSGSYGALLFIDLDNFKLLNDTHGHAAGDLLLIEAAARLQASVREMDTVARYGGDEFVVIVSELNVDQDASAKEAGIVAEKLRIALSAPYFLTLQTKGQADAIVEHRCAASIGVTLFGTQENNPDEILKAADLAMYQAKEAGRNVVRIADVVAAQN